MFIFIHFHLCINCPLLIIWLPLATIGLTLPGTKLCSCSPSFFNRCAGDSIHCGPHIQDRVNHTVSVLTDNHCIHSLWLVNVANAASDAKTSSGLLFLPEFPLSVHLFAKLFLPLHCMHIFLRAGHFSFLRLSCVHNTCILRICYLWF